MHVRSCGRLPGNPNPIYKMFPISLQSELVELTSNKLRLSPLPNASEVIKVEQRQWAMKTHLSHLFALEKAMMGWVPRP